MVVYVDELMILNLYIAFFLLVATEKLIHRPVVFWRRMAASVLAAVFSLYIFVPEIHVVLSALVRLVMSGAIVAVAFGIQHIRQFLKPLFVFWLANFLFAGTMYGIWALVLPESMTINNSFVYMPISPFLLILMTVVSYFMISIYRAITRHEKPKQLYTSLCLTYLDRTITVSAFLDTGNSLHDAFCDRPVVVLPLVLAAKLLPEGYERYFADCVSPPPDMKSYRLLPFHTVDHHSILPAFVATCQKEHSHLAPLPVTVAVCPYSLGGDYDALMGLGLSQCLEESV